MKSRITIDKKTWLNPLRIIFSLLLGLLMTIYQAVGSILSQQGVDKRTVSIVGGFGDRVLLMILMLLLFSAALWAIFLMAELLINKVREKYSDKERTDDSRKFTIKQKMILTGIYLICFLPFIIIYYPGISSPDTSRQIAMFFHLPTRVAAHMATNGIDVIYSAHHPLLTTWIYGGAVKLGLTLGNANLGILFCTLAQALGFALVFVWLTDLLKSFGAPKIVYRTAAIIWTVYPITWLAVVNVLSDSVFTLACLIYGGMLAKIVYSKGECFKKASFDIGFFASMLFLSLSKKQGIYIAFVLLLVLMIVYRRYFVRILIGALALIFVFNILFEGILYSALNVAQSGKQEMLSLPMQQSARVLIVTDKDGTVDKEYYDAFDSILLIPSSYSSTAACVADKYDPDLADGIKNRFNRDTGNDSDLKHYLKVWAKGFFRYPDIYFDAFFAGTYKYFYLSRYLKPDLGHSDMHTMQNLMDTYPTVIKEFKLTKDDYNYIDYESDSRLEGLRGFVSNIKENVYKVPVLRWFFSEGFIFYLVIAAALFLLMTHRWREAITVLPLLLSIAICCISPMNGCFRYAMPMLVGWPFILGILFLDGKSLIPKKDKNL